MGKRGAGGNMSQARLMNVLLVGGSILVLVWILLQEQIEQEEEEHALRRPLDFYNGGDHHRTAEFPMHHNRMRISPLHDDRSVERIAIVLPFVGQGPESVPPFLGLFCTAAGGAASIADFLLIHNGVLDSYHAIDLCPDNVKFISLQSMDNFAERYLIRVLDPPPQQQQQQQNEEEENEQGKEDHDKTIVDNGDSESIADTRKLVSRILTRHLLAYPYALVEFKPTYGHVFQEFIKGYSHWGYSDLDIIFGDLGKWITNDELKNFDIVTYGFGDQNRVYLRGQFTIHKNNDRINQLWRHCEYLAKLDERFADILNGKSKLRFESAEGCYSAVVLEQQDISVKYAVKAFTDIDERDTVHSHGLYVGINKQSGKSILYKAPNGHEGKYLTQLSSSALVMNDPTYRNRNSQLQREVGERIQIQFKNNDNSEEEEEPCMYWAQAKYQSRLCVARDYNVTETDTVFWINGKLYKQNYRNTVLGTNVVTAPFFHFQEWKRYYREAQLATFHDITTNPNTDDSFFSTFVLTKEGAIPVYPTSTTTATTSASRNDGVGIRTTATNNHNNNRRGVGHDDGGVVSNASPLGTYLPTWNGVVHGSRSQLPRRRYCLRSAPRKFPPQPPAPQCQLVVSWRDVELVEILSGAPAWKNNHVDMDLDVTLVLTVQITAQQAMDLNALSSILDIVDHNINRWQGQPCVLVIQVAGATIDSSSLIRSRYGNTRKEQQQQQQHNSDGMSSALLPFALDTCLVAAIYREEPDFVSRKALLNMAIDAVPTRWFVSGIEIERGLRISMDAAFFAHRTAKSYKGIPGSIFFIPQFALDRHNDRITLANLLGVKSSGDVLHPSKFEEGICDDDDANSGDEGMNSNNSNNKKRNDPFETAVGLWWSLLKDIVVSGTKTIQETNAIKKRAATQFEVELSLVELLMTSKHYELFAMDISPIFLMDNVGPHNDGMSTYEIVREVEEFGGKRCYNGLKPAQLATFGYTFNVLAGAFAASTVTSRRAAYYGASDEPLLGGSRCDGCFMFDDEHEIILEGIAKDERQRPAKAAILWEE